MNSRTTPRGLKAAATKAGALLARTEESLRSLGVTSSSKLLVAVSGGPDSLALAHAMQLLWGSGAYATLAIAHVDHGIRAESADDENAVRRYAAEWNVPIFVRSVETPLAAKRGKIGIEETARKQRYEFFAELLDDHQFDFVLTAHTANDQAETVLMHLVRGAGVHGLAGIPAKRKLGSSYVIRPWLKVTREEILEYVRANDLQPVNDASNEGLSYQRNRVRHIVMPALARAWPERSPVRTIAGLAERMREIDKFLTSITARRLSALRVPDGLSLRGVSELRGFELYAVLEAWIAETSGPFSISSRETSRIETWLSSESNIFLLRRGIQLRKHTTSLKIEKSDESFYFSPVVLVSGEAKLTPYGEFALRSIVGKPISKDPLVAQFDRVELGTYPIRVRPWRRSDRIASFGMGGKRRLVSDVLTDAKISGEERRNYPIVELEGNGILWVPGIRRSDVAPVTVHTREVLEIVHTPV